LRFPNRSAHPALPRNSYIPVQHRGRPTFSCLSKRK